MQLGPAIVNGNCLTEEETSLVYVALLKHQNDLLEVAVDPRMEGATVGEVKAYHEWQSVKKILRKMER